MNKEQIDLITLKETIKGFYDPTVWRFVTVNALEIDDGYEIHWVFSAIDQKIEEKVFFATIPYDASVPSVSDLIPSAKYSEAEMMDLLGIKFDGIDCGIFLEPDAPKAPLLRKNLDKTA